MVSFRYRGADARPAPSFPRLSFLTEPALFYLVQGRPAMSGALTPGWTTMETRRFQYAINADDVITFVDDAWLDQVSPLCV